MLWGPYLPWRRRWIRVFFSLRCFFFAIRLRRFLITEPTVCLSGRSVVVLRVVSVGACEAAMARRRRPSLAPGVGHTPIRRLMEQPRPNG